MAILPSPFGSNANPIRGAGLKRCPERQPAFDAGPMLTVGNRDPGTRGKVPPFPPHWTTPFSGLPLPVVVGVKEPSAGLNTGALAGLNALGSRLKACW